MKHGMWAGSLLLFLGSWTSSLVAREINWRPAAEVAGSAASYQAPAAELGRPQVLPPPPVSYAHGPSVLVTDKPTATPSVLPVQYQPSATVDSPGPLPSFLQPPPPAAPCPIIAVSAPAPTTPPVPGDPVEPSDFAIDRRPSASRLVGAPRLAATVTKAGMTGSDDTSPERQRRDMALPASLTMPAPDPAPSGLTPDTPSHDPATPSTWITSHDNPWGNDEAPFAHVDHGGDALQAHCYADAEYLLWWLKGENTPVLLTTSSPADFGILGAPTTRILFGGSEINNDLRSGGRLTLGYWSETDGLGIELGAFVLAPKNTDFTASSANFPVLGRPFFNVNTNAQFSQLIALPNVTTGNGVINAPSTLWAADLDVRCCLCGDSCWKINALGGFRYLDLDESIKITENIQGLATAPPPFTNQTITVFDRFATHNQFYGGEIGVDGHYVFGDWRVDMKAKLGLGATEQTLDIDGGQRFVAPDGTVAIAKGGLLALPSNIGHSSQARFSIVPEIGVTVGYQLTPHARAFLGYNFLYWTNVVRPGDQIDTHLNVSNIPNFPTNSPPSNINRPLPTFHESDIWAQGLLFGVEFTF